MKYLCTLMALIVLILSVQPVCAGTSPAEQCCTERTCDETPDKTSQKECPNGCNPFQLCGCCAFSAAPVQHPFTGIAVPFFFTSSSWTMLSCTIADEPLSGFWQPPRLA